MRNRDCRAKPNHTPHRLYATGRPMTAEQHRSAPIFDLLRQAYPRLPNRAPPNRTRPSPTLPGHSTSHHDCLDKPNTSVPRAAHQSRDCLDKPHASGTSPTVHCRDCQAVPSRTLPCQSATHQTSTASPCTTQPHTAIHQLTMSRAFMPEPYATVSQHRNGETPPLHP